MSDDEDDESWGDSLPLSSARQGRESPPPPLPSSPPPTGPVNSVHQSPKIINSHRNTVSQQQVTIVTDVNSFKLFNKLLL